VALFLDRARAARADFVLDESNIAAVMNICRGLDGLPLALEIAAARVGVLTTPDLLQRLRDRFALLTVGPRGEGERHRTLRSLVDWSYGLLDDTERAMFDRLSVFAGGWTLDAAAAVCLPGAASEADAAVLVANLADKSMVVPPSPSGAPRYGMLETLRLYGADHLEARGGQREVGNAHARYFLGLAEEAEAGLRGPHERDWVQRLHAELDNFRAAHEWSRGDCGDLDVALSLSVALHRFATWQANDEILSWAEAVVDLPGAHRHPLLPVVLGSAAVRRMHRGEMDIATEYAERALGLCDDGDDLRLALPVEALAGICLLSGRLDESLGHCIEFARLWKLAGYDVGEVWGLCNRAVIAAKQGDLPAAKVFSDQARTVAAPTANPTMLAAVSYCEGECLLEADPVQALEPIAQALVFARAADNVFMTGNALVSNTSLRGRHGDPSLALPLFEEVIDYWRRTGGWTQLWLTLRNLVELVGRLGAYEDAAVLFGACAAFNRTSRPYGAEADRLSAVVETLVANLDQRGFEDATARGEALDDGEAVEFAAAVTRRLQHT
jgi:tetratricopeptide (TPR) repeat protein